MNTTRVQRLTECVKQIDPDLFCMVEKGITLLCRKATVWEDYHDDGVRLLYSRYVPQVIFALTDTFTQLGNPIDLGIEPLVQRIRSLDSHGDFSEIKNVIPNLVKASEYKEKQMSNKFEEMAYEAQPLFKKAFADVNTSNMEKIDKRRLKDGSH